MNAEKLSKAQTKEYILTWENWHDIVYIETRFRCENRLSNGHTRWLDCCVLTHQLLAWEFMFVSHFCHHPGKRVSLNFWPIKSVWSWKVAFQTCNNLVICAILDDDSGLLPVWHRQDRAGFECTYSLDFKVYSNSYPFLAPDGSTVVIVPFSSFSFATCYL